VPLGDFIIARGRIESGERRGGFMHWRPRGQRSEYRESGGVSRFAWVLKKKKSGFRVQTRFPFSLAGQLGVRWIGSASCLLWAVGVFQWSISAAATVERRIEAVQSHLLPPVLIDRESPRTQTLTARMATLHVPGISIAVIHDGQIDWARGFGVARRDGTRVTPQTLFEACSISKPVSATAILRLVQDGKLDLDVDVNRYLKRWKLPRAPFAAHAEVTLRELLNHTAGVTVAGFPGYLPGTPFPNIAQILVGDPPANTPALRVDLFPGIGFRYSGGGYVVAQQVVEDVTGKPFSAVVRETVLTPAHLHDSVYQQPLQVPFSQSSAEAYDENGHPVTGGTRIYPELAPAGLWSTPTDLAKWAIEIQRALSGRSNPILSRSVAQQMLTPGLQGWGLGPAVGGRASHRYFTHSGVGVGMRTYLLAYTDGDGIVVMTNGANGAMLTEEVVRTVAEEYGWPDLRPAVHTVSRVSLHDDSAIVGTYQLSRYTLMHVTHVGDRLFVQRTGQGKLELLPEGHDRYFLRDVDCQFIFAFDPVGHATGFTSIQGGQIEFAKAITESQSESVRMSLAQKLHDNHVDPLSESALRGYIEQLRRGSVNYGRLSVEVAQRTRARQAEFSQLIIALREVQQISFVGVAPDGEDVFDVQFDNGPMRWSILPTEDGHVDEIGFTFLIRSVG
jgi:CubicO group peptidase (beta-lactamase class C family)